MKDDSKLLCGVASPEAEPWPPFDPRVLDFLSALSARALQDRQSEETAAFGFWCRPAHLRQLRLRHDCGLPRLGRGHIFHVAPSNVPALFGYSLAIGLLAGNSNTVRLSQRRGPVEEALCALLREVLDRPEFSAVKGRVCVVSYPREGALTGEYMARCDGRVLWGGDETIARLRAFPMKPQGVELCFPDRWSMALLSQRTVGEADEETLSALAHRFYNDTYLMDQQACSSPRLVLWLEDGGDPAVREKWWRALGREAAQRYDWNYFKAARKEEALCRWAMGWPEGASVEKYEGNLLCVVSLPVFPPDITTLPGGFGLFFQGRVNGVEELLPLLTSKVQTLVCLGPDPGAVAKALAAGHAAGVDRVVPPGHALEMDAIWDGKDLIAELSRILM